MSAHRDQPPEVDPVTGYDTTGHDWNGIKELNTPFPRIVIWALVITFVYSVIAWVLLPAFPWGRDYTRGLLGLDQRELAVEQFRKMDAVRQDWLPRFADADYAALAGDEALMAQAMPAAARLFQDNCAACHGATGDGGPGFPVLSDGYWLWGGDPETIAETLRYGINATHPDTRIAEMPSFNWMSREERAAMASHVAGMLDGRSDPDSAAGVSFVENCAACHGEAGEGGLDIGAPSLIDEAVIYGQDRASVMRTLFDGRAGVMPAWEGRLSEAEIGLLALYVSGLSRADAEDAQ
ncbi:cytochrome c oxidase cbb3-type subunit 3 [Paracoccus halophilus]|uniref:Cbb3-type cytochrome c oxidase subunit n=1 Tax=Paracoccus halophilus TaxID=376733 RepID=A0A099F9F6_9RHOB|nr:cytochrome-c oxidase, cbb3-type subunit III [Paracoccus halophilus]KGJ06848.1 hypothetical protein IT41_01355 [Paracoccus halophilus]SFA41149.1 cytochrome c oxidase cbb3-type subunit 3 [Paracoccus halophilus]